jgi:hypothetical protein
VPSIGAETAPAVAKPFLVEELKLAVNRLLAAAKPIAALSSPN